MFDFFSSIFGSLLNFVQYISHIVIVLFRNGILLIFVVAFLYGIFRLCRYGWQQLRRLRSAGPPGPGAPEDKPEDDPKW